MEQKYISPQEIQSYNQINSHKAETEIYLFDRYAYLGKEEIKNRLLAYQWPLMSQIDDDNQPIDKQAIDKLKENLAIHNLPNYNEPVYVI